MADEESLTNPEELFSNDPQENLRIENDILKLKLQAEHGAFFGGGAEDLPPEIENEFLMNVQKFEEAWKDVRYVTVYDFIGRPPFKPETGLSDEEIKTETERLTVIMNAKDVFLTVQGQYEPRIVYKFITEELFAHETDDMQLPGWTKNFTYEEFHPDHPAELRKTAEQFLKHWFERKFDEDSIELDGQLITGYGAVFSRAEVVEKLNAHLSEYGEILKYDHMIGEVGFECDEEGGGMGHAEGAIAYRARLTTGETISVGEMFKIYMSYRFGSWSVVYFVMPGFEW